MPVDCRRTGLWRCPCQGHRPSHAASFLPVLLLPQASRPRLRCIQRCILCSLSAGLSTFPPLSRLFVHIVLKRKQAPWCLGWFCSECKVYCGKLRANRPEQSGKCKSLETYHLDILLALPSSLLCTGLDVCAFLQNWDATGHCVLLLAFLKILLSRVLQFPF